MSRLAPEGPVYQAGTLSGNPVATTAGLTTLRLATDEVYAHSRPPGRRSRRACRSVDRGRRAARRSVQRHDVLGVLHRGAGARLRRRLGRGCLGVRGVLPRHAGRGRPPAAVGVRSVVPVRSPRRPRGAGRARRPASGRAGARRTRDPTKSLRWRSRWGGTAKAPMSQDDRPPAAARGGPQPDRRSLRPEPGLPPLRPGAADGREGGRFDQGPDITICRLPAGAGAGDRSTPCRCTRPGDRHRRAGDRVHERLRGPAVRQTVRPLRRPAAWRCLWNPFRPSWGEPYKELVARMMAAVEDARDAAPATRR